MSEADIHLELYRELSDAIESEPTRGDTAFGEVRPEYSADGFANLVIVDDTESPVLVIEAKAPSDSGRNRREIDPYAPKVIRQAFSYAGDIGAPYFATFNGDRLVVFDTDEEGVPLLDRSTKSYEIASLSTFADTLLDEISGIRAGDTRWDAHDDAFVARLRSLHEQLTPALAAALTEKLDTDAAFRERFARWTEAQGIEYHNSREQARVSVHREFAVQAGYLLVNKVLFYKLLENAPAYADTVEPLTVSPFRVQEDLEEQFSQIVDAVGFEAVFEHDEIYSEIPLASVSTRVREFIRELGDHDLTQFGSDVVGRIYEDVIPAARRREMGEYYTPPAICELITRLTIEDTDDEVLDPACGSGGFLLSAYNRKRELRSEADDAHERLLDGIHGIDINRFPAHLSAINLSLQDLGAKTETVDVEVADFFDVHPDTRRFGRVVAGAGGSEWKTSDTADAIGGVDAVVGNPPYIRQEHIADKDAVRAHLDNDEFDASGLSRRADIFAYFLTHGAQFLAEGGRLGYIVSDRWLDTKYGEDVQSFLLSNFEVDAVITFDKQVFDDALVDSSVLLLRKQSDPTARDENVTSFLRIREELAIESIVGILDDDTAADRLVSTEQYRLVTRTQQALSAEDKWNVFFYAPPLYFEFTALADVVELSAVADVRYGLKTGANPFFTANTGEWAELGLAEYVSPLLKATGQVERIVFSESAAEEWAILDVHDLVTAALEDMDAAVGEDDQRVRQWLSEHGHDALVEYIQAGRAEGYHERSSLQSRDVWFDLGSLTPPPMLHTQFTWREHRVVWNEADAVATNQFHCIRAESCPPKLLCALLNTRLVWLVKELTSRRTGGQGMTRLQTMVYETRQLPIPDPTAIPDGDRERIVSAFESLVEAEGADASTDAERDALDRAVLAVLGLDGSLDELKHAVESLVDSRETAAGKHTSVLVDRMRGSGETTVDLPGVASAREHTTLGDFE